MTTELERVTWLDKRTSERTDARDLPRVHDDRRIAEHRVARRLRRARRQGLHQGRPDLTPEELAARAGRWRVPPFLFETSLPGVFAVGDVRANSVKRVASAVGEGSICIQLVHKILAE